MNILITGDFCPARRLEHRILSSIAPETIFGEFLPVIRDADIAITNLECPLTLQNTPLDKTGPSLRANPDTIALLKRAGFNLLTLANNHILDYGNRGLAETLATCRQNDIDATGAGLNLHEASRTYHKQVGKQRIAVINVCESEFSIATDGKGGANPIDVIDNTYDIKEARENSDIVLVIVHGGNEYSHYPSPETVKLFRYFADVGASVVIAHHTHCVSGYEIYNDIPIFYSLGNFLFDRRDAPSGWHDGYAVLVKLQTKPIGFEIIPYQQCHNDQLNIQLLAGEEKQERLSQIEQYSRVIADPKSLQEEWTKLAQKNKYSYLRYLSGRSRLFFGLARRMRILESTIDKKRLRTLQNIIRCEAHRNLCLKILDILLT
jgi:poly-gamma-glutamate synthesis protein (capsule biosynthesis protein)